MAAKIVSLLVKRQKAKASHRKRLSRLLANGGRLYPIRAIKRTRLQTTLAEENKRRFAEVCRLTHTTVGGGLDELIEALFSGRVAAHIFDSSMITRVNEYLEHELPPGDIRAHDPLYRLVRKCE